MYPARFEYLRASSIDDALALLGQHDDAKVIAGGHSLLPMMKLRLAQPATLIDIGRLAELRGIALQGDRVRIGALTRHAELASSATLREHCPLVAEAAAQIGDPQVRNRGTIGGNIAHADPASDLPAVLVATGATVHLRGADGSRSVTARDFFVDLLTTDLAANELLVAVEVPLLGKRSGSCYLKFEHPASGYAVVGAAASLRFEGGAIREAALAFNGVTATPLDAGDTVAPLVGTAGDDAAIRSACETITAQDPLGDVFASGEYRVRLARVFGRRALIAARDRALA
jgi:carbon-monoxide dehydrogenase medium subunit